MTLSTRAEHERGRELTHVRHEVGLDVPPEGRAENAVAHLEAEEAGAVDVEAIAERVAAGVKRDAGDAARVYTEDAAVAERIGREFAEVAHRAVCEQIRGSPELTEAP